MRPQTFTKKKLCYAGSLEGDVTKLIFIRICLYHVFPNRIPCELVPNSVVERHSLNTRFVFQEGIHIKYFFVLTNSILQRYFGCFIRNSISSSRFVNSNSTCGFCDVASPDFYQEVMLRRVSGRGRNQINLHQDLFVSCVSKQDSM